MILPIYALGQPVLKKVAEDIGPDYEGLEDLLENMWETMYNANGVGLAAPQIGRSIRLFLVDTIQMMEPEKEAEGIKRAFINAQKIEEGGDPWSYEEGCLSIPDVRGDVSRPAQLKLRYLDENFEEHVEIFTGVNARVIQHEYDHLEGVLFIDYLSAFRKRMHKSDLKEIERGEREISYPVKPKG